MIIFLWSKQCFSQGLCEWHCFLTLANPLPAFSLEVLPISLNIAKFSLFFTLSQCTATYSSTPEIFRRESLAKSCAQVALRQKNEPKFRCYICKFKSMPCTSSFFSQCFVRVSSSFTSHFFQNKIDVTNNQREKQALVSTTCTAGFVVCT